MIGVILGELPVSRGPGAVTERRWVQVKTENGTVEAVALTRCRKGETVLLLAGETARTIAMDCPGDWAVAAVVAPSGNNG